MILLLLSCIRSIEGVKPFIEEDLISIAGTLELPDYLMFFLGVAE